MGYSLGGLVAAHVAARGDLPLPLSALVLLAPGLGLAQRLQRAEVDPATGFMSLPSAYVPAGYLVVGQKLLGDLHQNCNADADVAQALRLPTFIAHGEDDDTVAIEDIAAFHDLLGTSPGQSHLLRISGVDGGDHRLNRCIDRIFAQLECFLQQHKLLTAAQ